MKKTMMAAAMIMGAIAAPSGAQFGGSFGKALGKAVDTAQELTFSEAEEVDLGSQISAKLREKYGVVQDAAVHKYVTLVGSVLAADSARPNLKWTFIVLDTDGVNAFAAPGGFVHVTRGALALIRNEAELADVLGHEIAHVTEKHTVRAIEKSRGLGAAAKLTRKEFLSQAVDRGYSMVIENQFDRNQEKAADKVGVTLANHVGYQPSGLGAFLERLSARNANLKEPSGMFASHPDTQARLDALRQVIASAKLKAAATVAARYTKAITYTPVPVTSVAQTGAAPAAAPASGGSKLGLSGLQAMGREKSDDQTVSSAGSRGVNPDRDAKGGPNKSLVPVSVSKAEVAEFRRGITG
jgi:predicted Zn-dependent protease